MQEVRGFTLIEILVVMLIISIVTSVGMLSIAKNKNKQLEIFSNQLMQILSLAEEQAMLQPSALGLQVKEGAFQFASFQASTIKDKKAGWQPLEDRVLGKHAIPKGIVVSVDAGAISKEEEKAKQDPGIVISTNGELTPFTIYVGREGEKPRYAIRGEANGQISSQLLS